MSDNLRQRLAATMILLASVWPVDFNIFSLYFSSFIMRFYVMFNVFLSPLNHLLLMLSAWNVIHCIHLNLSFSGKRNFICVSEVKEMLNLLFARNICNHEHGLEAYLE